MPLSNPYQVQETDKDLLTLANRLQLEYQQVKGLNPNITSISQGQYINLPPTTAGMGGLPNPAAPTSGAGPLVDPRALAGGLANPANPARRTVSPSTPPNPALAGMGGLVSPYGGNYSPQVNPVLAGMGGLVSPDVQQTQAALYRQQLTNATNPSQLPPSISNNYLNLMGVTPTQMLAAGYVLQAGNWVQPGKGTVAGGSGGLDPNRPDSLKLVTINRNAKNKRNRYVTTLKHAKVMWKRKKQGRESAVTPGTPVRADVPSTTLDLILGS